MKNFEIERKFLVKKLPKNLKHYPKYKIKQGYLLIDEKIQKEIRVRQQNNEYFKTIKQGKGEIRLENEKR